MYKIFIAWRFLWARLVSYIGTLMLAAAVMLFIVVMAVMEGMGENLRESVRKHHAHVEVLAPAGPGIDNWRELSKKIAKIEYVKCVTPSVSGGAKAEGRRYRFQGMVRGIDLELERRGSGLSKYLPDEDFSKVEGSYYESAFVGARIAEKMEIVSGESIRLSAQRHDAPDSISTKRFSVKSEFKSGSFFADNGILIDLKQAQKLFGCQDRVTSLNVWLTDISMTHVVKRQIQYMLFESVGIRLTDPEKRAFDALTPQPEAPEVLAIRAEMSVDEYKNRLQSLVFKGAAREAGRRPGHYVELSDNSVKTWAEQMPDVFNAIYQEAWIMRIILAVVVFFVAVLVFCLLWILVDVKTSDIGILVALGANVRGIVAIFVLDGFIIGLMGTLLGLAAGSLIALNMDTVTSILKVFNVNVFPEQMFYGTENSLPSTLKFVDILFVSVVSVGLSVVASILPAAKAARANPIESLRHE